MALNRARINGSQLRRKGCRRSFSTRGLTDTAPIRKIAGMFTKKRQKNRHKMTFLVSDEVRQRIEKLQRQTDAASMTEVIRRAMSCYETCVNVRHEGGRVVLEDKNGKLERLVI